VLVDLARLNLDERAVRIQEAQVALVAGALTQALAEAGLTDGQQTAIQVRVGELIEAADGAQQPVPCQNFAQWL
jgi:hypothetical protein